MAQVSYADMIARARRHAGQETSTFVSDADEIRSVLRTEIKDLKSTQTSLMPDGLEAALNAQSLADLIKYLQTPKS